MATQPIATTADEVYIEADDDDLSSGYVSTRTPSSTDSLASSLNRYLEENGRKYHAYYGQDKNYMPADDAEKERLDIEHEVFRLIADQKIYHAPVQNPQRVLDLGTGTGIWAIDFADENPQAEVTGIDLSPIQPGWVPPNCKFETDDLELDWTYPKDTYDFVHSRNVINTISNPQKYISKIYSILSPGSFVEMAELDGTIRSDDDSLPADWPPVRHIELSLKALAMIGKGFINGDELAKLLKDAGFVDIAVLPLKIPLGPWPKKKALKQAGHLQSIANETGYHAYGLALFTRVLGMSEEEALKVCDDARDAAEHRSRKEKVHDYMNFYIVHARKPEAE